jgi:hypothetical protein
VHVVVPESQNLEILSAKPCIANSISFYPMLPAIDLDDQSRSQANKVRNVGSDRHLASERSPTEPMRAQPVPELAFGIHHRGAERTGVRSSRLRHIAMRHLTNSHPPPGGFAADLPRKGGGCTEIAARLVAIQSTFST